MTETPTAGTPEDYSQAIAALDLAALARCAAAAADGAPARQAAGAWHALLAGAAGEARAQGEALLAAAARAGDARRVIEATVLRALAAASAGERDQALELARRAARMAQTEAVPALEVLAGLALARLRRLLGRPHLALRILGAVARVAPPPWHPWVAWEAALAGGPPGALPPVAADRPGPAADGARALEDLVAAAAAGDRARFEQAAAAAAGAVAACPDLARELEACRTALDPDRDPAPPGVQAWRTGETAEIPAGLDGLGTPADAVVDAEVALAFVLVEPGGPGRRLLRAGLGLCPGVRNLERERTPARGLSRTDSGLAALALAGPDGLDRDQFFQRLYGFRFQRELHQGALDVLVHRMRARLGTAGTLARDRDTGRLCLTVPAPLAIPDPRCAMPLGERVLRALAALGGAGAQETAEALRMPLRTVQTALQQLVADGACVLAREGRRVAYHVQDTTFTDPGAGGGPARMPDE